MGTTGRSRMGRQRYEELSRILEEHREEILSEVNEKMHDVRTESKGALVHGVLDDAENSEADIQSDIEFALLQMKTETLTKIGTALSRLEAGSYGYCFECGDEISQQRLRALLLAVRCKSCEEVREVAKQRECALTQRRGALSVYSRISN